MTSDVPLKLLHTEVCSFPRPLYDRQVIDARPLISISKDVRFPCIHKSDPFAFHSVNTLLSKNHAADPLCRAFETKF